MKELNIISRLANTIEKRKASNSDGSYVVELLSGKQDQLLRKISEEATEVLLASKDGDKAHITYEMADLWFHCLVLLAKHNIRPEDVLSELERREGVSGIEEKASRKPG
ncbi:MAG: phosphoribosyl-ATP diphosphatase [Nitrosomonadaceae bacterium]|nr:phosphoribosyl-ATP diphosphatase [Nitrosomonadaceae bacterium]|tara:strand:+ start:87 stop:413 length:327 start_codon:yes stop_codon:yes gene_type:complete